MDVRATTASYYDLAPDFPDDVPFYLAQLPGASATVLELGCGTGRVTVPLAQRAKFTHGVDLSPAMIARCNTHLQGADLAPSRASATVGDITALALGTRFDLIIAPYRVFQNLVTEAEVVGFFATVHRHLARGGRCILNTFRPYADPAALLTKWRVHEEDPDWERPLGDDVIRHSVRRGSVDAEPLVIYPDLIYRRYRAGALVEEVVSSIAMRCWYPDELLGRVRAAGLAVLETWGGYAGEGYGTGPELVIAATEA